MARNGSGVYVPPAANYPAVSGTLITAADRNAIDADIATALTNSIAVNGESVVTGNIPLGGNKLTGVGAATARTDAATLATIQDGTGVYVATVGGTADVITLTSSPAITAYSAGQLFSFIASGANTTNVTVNVNGLGAKAITKNGATALVAGDIPSGFLVSVRYDGTQFQLVGAKNIFTGGTLTSLLTQASGADIASASTVDLTAATGNTLSITGTTTITAFTMNAGQQMELIAVGALPLTYHATTMNINGGVSYTCVAGDRLFINKASDNVIRVNVIKQDGTAVVTSSTGRRLAQIVTFQTGAVATGTTVIPFDNTIPQNTEGDQYMSLSVTPQNAGSTLEIDVSINFSNSVGGRIISALFQDAVANALCVGYTFQNTGTWESLLTFKYVATAGTVSATAFKVRAGGSAAGTTTFNGSGGTQAFGGVIASRITIKEYLP